MSVWHVTAIADPALPAVRFRVECTFDVSSRDEHAPMETAEPDDVVDSLRAWMTSLLVR